MSLETSSTDLTNNDRLILYYPVSSLVTLFANILQNPQDSRARSDLKLMNLVVSFLSTLCSDEANGSVRRMLNVCSEFERIAKVVLDKADKEQSSRRKRKQQDGPTDGQSATAVKSSHQRTTSQATTMPSPAGQGTLTAEGNIPNVFTPPNIMANIPENVSF